MDSGEPNFARKELFISRICGAKRNCANSQPIPDPLNFNQVQWSELNSSKDLFLTRLFRVLVCLCVFCALALSFCTWRSLSLCCDPGLSCRTTIQTTNNRVTKLHICHSRMTTTQTVVSHRAGMTRAAIEGAIVSALVLQLHVITNGIAASPTVTIRMPLYYPNDVSSGIDSLGSSRLRWQESIQGRQTRRPLSRAPSEPRT
jgi:hypothetical protein